VTQAFEATLEQVAEQESLVEPGSGGRLRVNRLSADEIRGLYQARAALEGLAATNIISHRNAVNRSLPCVPRSSGWPADTQTSWKRWKPTSASPAAVRIG